jgi:hypothetical protein
MKFPLIEVGAGDAQSSLAEHSLFHDNPKARHPGVSAG